MSNGSSRLVELRDGLHAHTSGAAWISLERTMLVADLHLGYAWAQRRRGELGPVATGGIEKKLFAAIEELYPRTVVVLGDLVHAPRPSAAEFAHISETLHQLRQRSDLILVGGNHDRGLAHDFGIDTVPAWQSGDFLAVHGDQLPDAADRCRHHCLYGHWHPTLLLKDAAGANTRYPAFLCSKAATVLPAFSPFSRGLDARRPWPADLREAVGFGWVRFAITSGRSIRMLPMRPQNATASKEAHPDR